jgi:hypothetical protein
MGALVSACSDEADGSDARGGATVTSSSPNSGTGTSTMPDATAEPRADMTSVIVSLAGDWSPEADLPAPEDVTRQRAQIAALQQDVMEMLRGTQFVMVRLYEITPQMALQVDAAALERLRQSKLVAAVDADTPDPATG